MQISLVLIIYRSDSAIAQITASNCENCLKNEGISSITVDSKLNKSSIESIFKTNSKFPQLAIVLGGDGTVLKSANALINFKIPILSFNIGGHLGFLSQEKEFLLNQSFISMLKNNEFKIEERNMLQCKVFKKDSQKEDKSYSQFDKFFALNDFYFKSVDNDISPTNQIQLEINGEKVNEYKGDGLIIASATGSTAYSMAAGGPIVHPEIDIMIINPICPMSLSNRPIIIPSKSTITVKPVKNLKRSLQLWQDGSKSLTISYSDYCEINKAETPAKMISLKNSISYYSTLIKKLDWKGNLS